MIFSPLDWLVLAAYGVALLGVGVASSRRIDTSTDYAIAGRTLGRPVLTGTLIGSVIGAAATLGKAGKAYEAGYAVLLASVAYFFGYVLFAALAPRLRAAEIDSLPDVLERRFGSGMRLVASGVLLLVVIPVVGMQLTACGVILSETLPGLGLDYGEAVLGAALVIALYTLAGGLLAVAYTDLIQVAIMTVGIGILVPVFVGADLGGLDEITRALSHPTEDPLGGMDWGYVLSFGPIFTAFVLIDPSAWQRVAAARRVRDLKPAMLWTAAFYAGWSVLVIALGVAAVHLYPSLPTPDAAIPQMVIDYLPPAFKGLCLAAIVALIMSTADTALLIAGSTIGKDVLQVLRPETEDRTVLRVSRGSILVVSALGVLFALARISLFAVNAMALGLFVAGLFVPVMAALFWPKATRRSAIAAAAAGTLTSLASQVAVFSGVSLPFEPILAGLAASAGALFLTRRLEGAGAEESEPVLAKTS